MIGIKAEKRVGNEGILGMVIKDFNMLRRTKLPTKYLDGEVYCYKDSTNMFKIHLEHGIIHTYCIDRFYEKSMFEQMIIDLKLCGDRLMEINKELKNKRKKWNGEITINI